MTKESGYPKGARSGKDGFRNAPGRTENQMRGTSMPKVPGAHGFGHTRGQMEGSLRNSGDGRAHRVGRGCK